MIVLIAPEIDIINEIEILNQLFQEGLQYYHLRKPNKNYDGHCDYLNKIDKKYHNRIVTHHFHELVNYYDLKGIHFKESKRKKLLNEHKFQDKNEFLEYYAYTLKLNKSVFTNKSISASFHDIETLNGCYLKFNYHLLSPVFSSISKKGYQGRNFNVNNIKKPVIGMGGVTTKNLDEFTKLGFNGVAVLGSIWNSKNPISNFKQIQNYFTEVKSYI